MADLTIPELPLGCGSKKIPVLAMGTASYPPLESESCREAILDAIRIGHRHFDTASMYNTEKPLGEAVAEAVSLGLVKSRDELFITSKLWCSDAHADRVIPAIKESLKNLQLEYLDLYLIHWPITLKSGKSDFPINEEDVQPIDLRAVWEAMEECQRLGLTKSIGVSNFSCKKLSDLLLFAKFPPVVNQVEMHPVWQQKKLIDFCKLNKILVAAYSPLGGKGTPWGTSSVMDSQVIKQIAEAKGKTIAQVCLRWAYEQGIVIVAKSFNKERMRENLEIFDWKLSDEDSKIISEIPQSKTILGDFVVSEDGPFKSLQDLWDGEI